MAKLTVTPIRPMVIESRAPCRIRLKMSRPSRSEPKRKKSPSSGGQITRNRLSISPSRR